jgi:hypothetical protein
MHPEALKCPENERCSPIVGLHTAIEKPNFTLSSEKWTLASELLTRCLVWI